MLRRLFAIALLGVPLLAQTLRWTDQGESELGLAAAKEVNPAQKLELLTRWEQKYPVSSFQNQRTLMVAQAELSILGAGYNKPVNDPALALAETAGKDLEEHFAQYFADSVKPDKATEDQWTNAKKSSGLQIHTILANIAQTKKDDATAELEYGRALAIDPTQAATSYFLGLTILREMAKASDVRRYPEAIYHLAHALSVTGPNALPPTGRAADEASLKKALTAYHGESGDMPGIVREASASPMPPFGFRVLTVLEENQIHERGLAATPASRPDLLGWNEIKIGINRWGPTYFAPIEGAPVPGKLKATVVSQPSPNVLLVNVDDARGDAMLKFNEKIKVPEGAKIEFAASLQSYATSPYLLYLTVQSPKTDFTVTNRGNRLGRFFRTVFAGIVVTTKMRLIAPCASCVTRFL